MMSWLMLFSIFLYLKKLFFSIYIFFGINRMRVYKMITHLSTVLHIGSSKATKASAQQKHFVLLVDLSRICLK